MKLLKKGRGGKLPEVGNYQHLFVDKYDNWKLYESGYSTLAKRIEEFVDSSRDVDVYFSPSDIAMYKCKKS